MKKALISAIATAGFVFVGSAHANVQHEISVFGQESDVEFANPEFSLDGDVDSYGISYALTNIYTNDSGILYRGYVSYSSGDVEDFDIDVFDFGYTSGYRFDTSERTSLDLILGVGMDYTERNASDRDLRDYTIYARYGVGVQFDANSENTLRLEGGAKLTAYGDMELEVDSMGSETVDLDNDNNLYAEASWLNTSTGIPVKASVFYEQMDRTIDSDRAIADLESSSTGVKVSVLF